MDIIIAGGGKISYYLADLLSDDKVSVTILEKTTLSAWSWHPACPMCP